MLKQVKENYRLAISGILKSFEPNIDTSPLRVDVPLERSKGDLAVPFFAFSKVLKKSPADLANAVDKKLKAADKSGLYYTSSCTENGFLNIFLDKNALGNALLGDILASKDDFAAIDVLKGEKIMVEFSCPNTNKPLHLGHIRNDALGSSIANLLAQAGAEVFKVNLVNDRGIHICKSMLSYKLFSKGATPESTGIKPDHFVGDYYVKYNQYEKENEEQAKASITDMLQKWEAEDEETRKLWLLMRKWAIDGIQETYDATGIVFDKTYYESQLYKKGKAEVEKGLKDGIFYKDASGAVMVKIGDKEKVLLRSDGTSIYLTQDIGTAIQRHNDWPYTSCIYVVGNEQKDHFKVLFAVLEKLGFEWSRKLKHLSYGMVNLPDGRMKTRDGTVVDADDLLSSLSKLSLESMSDKITDKKERKKVADKVALGALNYFLLANTPEKDMTFNPKESLSFSGNTGPYIQYTGARISSLLSKAEGDGFLSVKFRAERQEQEAEILFQLSCFETVIEKAALAYDPSLLCSYIYNLCKVFSSWYHDVQILKATGDLRDERLAICYMVLCVLKKSFAILGIPFLTGM